MTPPGCQEGQGPPRRGSLSVWTESPLPASAAALSSQVLIFSLTFF